MSLQATHYEAGMHKENLLTTAYKGITDAFSKSLEETKGNTHGKLPRSSTLIASLQYSRRVKT